MVEVIEEPVRVAAVFNGRRTEIRWLQWRGRDYRIRQVTDHWRAREGQALLHYFTVTDGAMLFELRFHAEQLAWELTRTYCEG